MDAIILVGPISTFVFRGPPLLKLLGWSLSYIRKLAYVLQDEQHKEELLLRSRNLNIKLYNRHSRLNTTANMSTTTSTRTSFVGSALRCGPYFFLMFTSTSMVACLLSGYGPKCILTFLHTMALNIVVGSITVEIRNFRFPDPFNEACDRSLRAHRISHAVICSNIHYLVLLYLTRPKGYTNVTAWLDDIAKAGFLGNICIIPMAAVLVAFLVVQQPVPVIGTEMDDLLL